MLNLQPQNSQYIMVQMYYTKPSKVLSTCVGFFRQIDERLGAVEELRELPQCMFRLKQLLASLPDVEKALTTIIHAKVYQKARGYPRHSGCTQDCWSTGRAINPAPGA